VQFARRIEATTAQYIKDVRKPVEDAFIAMKKLQLGASMVAESRSVVDKLSRDMVDLAAKRDSVGPSSMASNVKKQHAGALNKASKSGLYRSVTELERAPKHALTDVNRRYDALPDAAKKHAFEQL
jgi:hypothetical protein